MSDLNPLVRTQAFIAGASQARDELLFSYFVASSRASLTDVEQIVNSMRLQVAALEGELGRRLRDRKALGEGTP